MAFRFDRKWLEFLLSKKLNMLTIHLRTVREMSKVPAHFELLPEIIALRDKIAPETLIVANGDVQAKKQGQEIYDKYNVDGVMIGRGVFNNPFALSDTDKWLEFTPIEKIGLYEKHVRLFQTTWQNNERPIVTLNKFCKIYISGFDGAKELREDLMKAADADDLLGKLEKIKLNLL